MLKQLDTPFHKVILGEAHACNELDNKQKATLEQELRKLGFELIDRRKNQLIEKVA